MLVFLLLIAAPLAMVDVGSASGVRNQRTTVDPDDVALADFDGDGDLDMVTSSAVGHRISVTYNLGNGEFGDRSDIWISRNGSDRAGTLDLAMVEQVEVGDFNGDNCPDIVLWQQGFVAQITAKGNLTFVLNDGCTGSPHAGFTVDTSKDISLAAFVVDLVVTDIDDPSTECTNLAQGNPGCNDILLYGLDYMQTSTFVHLYRGGTATQAGTPDVNLTLPASESWDFSLGVGDFGEQKAAIGDCDDRDLWLVSGPPTGGVGWTDNVSVITYNCITQQFDSMPAPGSAQRFSVGVPYGGFGIGDEDGDNIIDVVAMNNGWNRNATVIKRAATGNPFSQANAQVVPIGNHAGDRIFLDHINGDSKIDVIVPSVIPVETYTDSLGGSFDSRTVDGLGEPSVVQVMISDGSGGFLSPLSFPTTGRRPNIVQIADLFGDTTPELVVGHRDYRFMVGGYGFFNLDSDGDGVADTNFGYWEDSWTEAGQIDGIGIINIDAEDLAITSLSVSPAGYGTIGAGTRNVSVDITNTGLDQLGGTIDVTTTVKEVTGGTNTTVYQNDFDSAAVNPLNANLAFEQYLGGTNSWHIETNHPTASQMEVNDTSANLTNPTNFMWAGTMETNTSDGVSHSGYLPNRDDAMLIQSIDLTGADAARLGVQVYFDAWFSVIRYGGGATGVIEPRTIIEDVGLIEVRRQSGGWETLQFYGGFDFNRQMNDAFGLDEGQNAGSAQQLGYSNGYHWGYRSYYGWLNFTDGSELDLSRYAGEVIDLRFRFRSNTFGSVNADDDWYIGFDGFAVDNLSITKESLVYGGGPQQKTNPVALGTFKSSDQITTNMSFNFDADKEYKIDAAISNFGSVNDGDDRNDESGFRLYTENIYDPEMLGIEMFGPDEFAQGRSYADGARDVSVRVAHRGSTVVDFDVELEILSATAATPLLEDDFEKDNIGYTASYQPAESNQGAVIDDSSSTKLFNSYAWWFGDPISGYGANWDNYINFTGIDLTSTTADYAFLEFDYFADLHYLVMSDGTRYPSDALRLYLQWDNTSSGGTHGGVYEGQVLGSWANYEDVYSPGDRCTIERGSAYGEEEYFGDVINFDENRRGEWLFSTDGRVESVKLDLTHLWVENRSGQFSRSECIDLSGSMVEFQFRFTSDSDFNGGDGFKGVALDNVTVAEYSFSPEATLKQTVTGLDAQEERVVTMGNHLFDTGIYQLRATSIYDNQTIGKDWYDQPELRWSNNKTSSQVNIVSTKAKFGSMRTLDGVYPISSTLDHTFRTSVSAGTLGAEFTFALEILDSGGSVVQTKDYSNGATVELEAGERKALEITPDYNFQSDETYTIRWTATYPSDGSEAAEPIEMNATFSNSIDVLVLNTDASLIYKIKTELDALGLDYTMLRGNPSQPDKDDWGDYFNQGWFEAYDRILIQRLKDEAAYNRLFTLDNDDSRGPPGVVTALEAWAGQIGHTLQVHLPAANPTWLTEYDNAGKDIGKLPFGLRPAANSEFPASEATILDPFHPLTINLSSAEIQTLGSGSAIEARIETSSALTDVPSVCTAESATAGLSWRSLIGDDTAADFNSERSVLASCQVNNKGTILMTTLNVDSTSTDLLSTMLSSQFSPYEAAFDESTDIGIRLDPTSQEQAPLLADQASYAIHWMKNDVTVSFDYLSILDASRLTAYWALTGPSKWSGATSNSADSADVKQADQSSARFCVEDTSKALSDPDFCRRPSASSYTEFTVGTETRYGVTDENNFLSLGWKVDLYLYDDLGHSLKRTLHLGTNPDLADSEFPMANFTIKDPTLLNSADNPDGWIWDMGTLDGVPYYVIQLDSDGLRSLTFDAGISNDPDYDTNPSSNGIAAYEWTIRQDLDCDSTDDADDFTKTSTDSDFARTFRSITVGKQRSDRSIDPLCDVSLDPLGEDKWDIGVIYVDLRVQDLSGKWSNQSTSGSGKHTIKIATVPHYYDVSTNSSSLAQLDWDAATEALDDAPLSKADYSSITLSGILTRGPADGSVEIRAVIDDKSTFESSFQIAKKEGSADEMMVNAGDQFSLTLDLSDKFSEDQNVDLTIHIRYVEKDADNKILKIDGQDVGYVFEEFKITLAAARVRTVDDIVAKVESVTDRAICSNLGLRLLAGKDANTNGELDESEIALTLIDCNSETQILAHNNLAEVAPGGICGDKTGLRYLVVWDANSDGRVGGTETPQRDLTMCAGDDLEALNSNLAASNVASDDSGSGGLSSTLIYVIAGVLGLVVVGVLIMFVFGRGGGSGSDGDLRAAVSGGGVAVGTVGTMDPMEAYVQQLVAQGYPEETARAYAVHYFQQQG